ncbi:MAG: bifunctional glycosyltransferase/class I SAM-dependent methyltransferase [Patescibacteria group bacterium]
MLKGKKIIAILPAYNAGKTLRQTLNAIPRPFVDDVILVDDKSRDNTVEVSRSLGIKTFPHKRNRGYGGNQKTCYREALLAGADIVVMVHPDFQYDPVFIPEMVSPISEGRADAVFGSRMMQREKALVGGMPRWKWIANILLTKFENFCLGLSLTEYHSGFRAYSRRALELPIELNSDNFVFDTEIIVQLKVAGLKIEEIPITTRYFPDASMIGFWRSVKYGLSIIAVMGKYFLHKVLPLRQFTFIDVDNGKLTCPVCKTKKSKLLYPKKGDINDLLAKPYLVTDEKTGTHGEVRECLLCKVAFVTDIQSLQSSLTKYYESAPLDTVYVKDALGRRKTARNILSRLSGRTLLDFGSNVGIFLDEAKGLGWQVSGVEASRTARDYAKSNFSIDIMATLKDASTYDCIVLLDVLEHIRDPLKLVKDLADRLSPEGTIVITAPDASAPITRLWGRAWHALVPAHFFFFSPRSIEYIADQSGLEVLSCRQYVRHFSIDYMFQRLLRSPNLHLPVFGKFVLPATLFDEPLWILRKAS